MKIKVTNTLFAAASAFRATLLEADTRATHNAAIALRQSLVVADPSSGSDVIEPDIPGYEPMLESHLDGDGVTEDRPDGIEDSDTIYIALMVSQALTALDDATSTRRMIHDEVEMELEVDQIRDEMQTHAADLDDDNAAASALLALTDNEVFDAWSEANESDEAAAARFKVRDDAVASLVEGVSAEG